MSVRTTDADWAGPAVGAQAVASREARSAQAFLAARRHSALVRALRVALAVGTIGAVAYIVGSMLYRTFGAPLSKLSIGAVSIDGAKITMVKPRLTGSRQNGGGYVITAARAIQDIHNPTIVELVDIDGDIGSADHDNLKITAAAGEYDSVHETLQLFKVVRLHNSRYTVDLHSAHIEFKTGAYGSNDPVSVVTDTGSTILADSASIGEGAGMIAFQGHVRTKFLIPDDGGVAAEPAKGTQP